MAAVLYGDPGHMEWLHVGTLVDSWGPHQQPTSTVIHVSRSGCLDYANLQITATAWETPGKAAQPLPSRIPDSRNHEQMQWLFKLVHFRIICYVVIELEHSPPVNNDKIGQNIWGRHFQTVLNRQMLKKGKLMRWAQDHPALCLGKTSHYSMNSWSPRNAPLSWKGRDRGSGQLKWLKFWKERELCEEDQVKDSLSLWLQAWLYMDGVRSVTSKQQLLGWEKNRGTRS